jgi:hypothetical protein
MAWKATTTPGTQFKIDLATTPLLLEGVTSLTPPAGSRPTSEWTPISSTTGKKYKSGRPAFGKVAGELAVDPTDPSFLRLLALYNAAPASALTDVEVALTDNGLKAYKWTAFVDEFGITFPNEGVVKARFGLQATTGATALSPTAVTPSTIFDPEVGQGTTLGFWVTSAYQTLKGVEMIELAGGSRDSTPATPIDAAVASAIAGYRGQTKLTFDLLYDSTEANHLALFASFNSLAPVTDKFKIHFASGAHFIELTDVNVDSWAWPASPGTNRVKVSAAVNVDIAIS